MDDASPVAAWLQDLDDPALRQRRRDRLVALAPREGRGERVQAGRMTVKKVVSLDPGTRTGEPGVAGTRHRT